MKILKTQNSNFYNDLSMILQSRSNHNIDNIDELVKNIILDIKQKGDKALFDYTKQFDGTVINSFNILLSKEIRNSYKEKINQDIMNAFKIAIENITRFHEKQKPKNYQVENEGVKTDLVWKPLQSVGLYIPGGKAVYPSSLLMNVIPAKVAGVKRIVVVTPPKSNEINPYILALLDLFSITEIYKVGGAQSIAALAYGTDTIKPVNKIFGPGNAYVTSAKKQVFGKVGIDLIAGPSEIVVVADKGNNPKWVASDLMAQAEHDENTQSILITDDNDFAHNVIFSIKELNKKLPRKQVIENSLNKFGTIIITNNFKDTNKIIDFIAPEHLHLQNKSRYEILKKVNNAGCIFVGELTSEAFGDYIVGTNHILPTSGSAKFSSGLGVIDFMKRSSIVEINRLGYELNQENVRKMAEVEKLEGHKLSVKIRQIEKN